VNLGSPVLQWIGLFTFYYYFWADFKESKQLAMCPVTMMLGFFLNVPALSILFMPLPK